MGLVLTVTSVVGAAPTIGSCTNLTGVCVASPDSVLDIPLVANVANLVDCPDPALAAASNAFLKPNSDLTVPAPLPDRHSADLPAVPPAMLMVILGSLCVILVRDRALWFTACSGLMWFGLTGIQLVPQLALRLTHGSHNGTRQLDGARDARLCYREVSWRLRSETDGTQYIGLLHHLAGIPLGTGSELIQSRNITLPWLLAFVLEQHGFSTLSMCPAPEATHIVCLLPAVREGLWRAPPNLGKKLLTLEVT